VVKARLGDAVAMAVAQLRDWGRSMRSSPSAQKVGAGGTALTMAAYEAGRPSAEAACRFGDERFIAAT
jgi:hydrogenase maturation protease